MAKIKFIKFSIVVFIAAGFVFLLGKDSWFPEFYAPKLFGAFSLFSVFLILFPKLILKISRNESAEIAEKKNSALEGFQAALAFSLILNGLGSLGMFQLYKYGFQYDKLVHFFTGLVMTVVLIKVLDLWCGLCAKKSFFISASFILLAGVSWEVLEYLSDLILGTATFGIYGMHIAKDTILDLLFDAGGIFTGLLVARYKRLTGQNKRVL